MLRVKGVTPDAPVLVLIAGLTGGSDTRCVCVITFTIQEALR
jgi:hypothetical protein